MPDKLALALTVALIVSACSAAGDTTSATAGVTSTAPSSTTTSIAATTTSEAPTTTTVGSTTSTAPEIDVVYADGEVVGAERFEYSLGDEVSIWVLSDVEDEIHVHGYDLFFEAEDGVPVEVAFSATIPGIFEVEMESDHTLLFELELTP